MSPWRSRRQANFQNALPVVAEHADFPENIAQHDQAAPDIVPAFLFRADRHFQPVGVGILALILIAREQLLGLIGDLHALAPRTDHLVVRQQEIDVGIAAVVLDQPVFALQAIPQRRLRQRLQQIDGQQRNPGFIDKGEQRIGGFGLVGIEAHDDAGNDLHADMS